MLSHGNKAARFAGLYVFASFSSALLVVSVVHYSLLNIIVSCDFCPALIHRSCVNKSYTAGDAGILWGYYPECCLTISIVHRTSSEVMVVGHQRQPRKYSEFVMELDMRWRT